VKRSADLAGRQFGGWTVLARAEQKGSAKWLCRCRCGTQRVVAAKNLLAGTSASCGCGAKERFYSDISGQKFGMLLAVERLEGGKWKCICECGRECTAERGALLGGRKKSCGCMSRRGRHTAKDAAGQRFGMLTALRPTDARSQNGSVLWLCRCDCGGQAEVALDKLRFGGVRSCGCMREKSKREISGKLTHAGGTSIDAIRSGCIRSDNKTGVKGVYQKRGKFCAEITFQKKNYYLGSFSTVGEAALARRKAEDELHGEVLAKYSKWKKKAQAEPEWASKNPITFAVRKKDDGFCVTATPDLQ